MDQNLKLQKWTNHIVNKREHDSELFPRCLHGELEGRAWLKEGRYFYQTMCNISCLNITDHSLGHI